MSPKQKLEMSLTQFLDSTKGSYKKKRKKKNQLNLEFMEKDLKFTY